MSNLHYTVRFEPIAKVKQLKITPEILKQKNQLGRTALHCAVAVGRLDVTEYLIRCGADLSQLDPEGNTALHLACLYREPDLVDLLVSKGASLLIKNSRGQTPKQLIQDLNRKTCGEELDDALIERLFAAVGNDDPKELEKTIQLGAKLDSRDDEDLLPIQFAVTKGSLKVLEYLLKSGESLEEKTIELKSSLLHLAAAFDQVEVIQFLVAKGLDVHTSDVDLQTPIHRAAKSDRPRSIKALAKAGAALEGRDRWGQTPILLAAWFNACEAMSTLIKLGANERAKDARGQNVYHAVGPKGAYQALEFLLKHKIPGLKALSDEDKGSALHCAALSGRVDFVQRLVKEGLDLHQRDGSGFSMLHLAAAKGCEELVKYLIKQGLEIDARSAKDKTPLHLAAKHGHIAVVDLLLASGADLEAKAKNSYTPIRTAIAAGHIELVKHLKKRGAEWHRVYLLTAACKGQSEMLQLLLNHGLQLNHQCRRGDTALHFAAWNGHSEVIKVLLTRGASPSIRNKIGQTPFLDAAETGKLEALKLFLENGAKPGEVNKDGMNALHLAVKGEHTDLVHYLGSNYRELLTKRNKKGETPRVVANQEGHQEIVKLLNRYEQTIHLPWSEESLRFSLACALHSKLPKELEHIPVVSEQIYFSGKLQSALRPKRKKSKKVTEGLQALFEGKEEPAAKVIIDHIRRRAKLNPVKDGKSHLHHAAEKGWVTAAKLLVANGAKVNFAPSGGELPIVLAAKNGRTEMVRFLTNFSNTGLNEVIEAAKNYPDTVMALLGQ